MPQATSTRPTGGGGAGVIGPPDTGSGPGGEATSWLPEILLAMGAFTLVAGWGLRTLTEKRRA